MSPRSLLLAAVDTITQRDRQFTAYAMALAGVNGNSPSRGSREIDPADITRRERQHLLQTDKERGL